MSGAAVAPTPLVAYLAEHALQEKLTLVLKKVLRDRPANPIAAIGSLLVKEAASMGKLTTLSWNMAAINNNPFEYWLTHPDKAYSTLMEDVERLISDPGTFDEPVQNVFTDAMYKELDELMTKAGFEGSEQCTKAWEDLAKRPIVSGFIKDKGLGDKRLMSMPDRMTNTIDVLKGGEDSSAYRPSVISSSFEDMPTVEKWWPLWKKFMFEESITVPGHKGAPSSNKLPCELLTKIPRSKYPALTEEEEAISVRLQTVCLAVFDAILVHMLQTLTPDGKWVALKRSILQALTLGKESKQIEILQTTYAQTDVLFLQEVRTSMMQKSLPAAFQAEYAIAVPKTPSKADQNSIVCLSKSRFDPASLRDLTAEVLAEVPKGGASLSAGDLFVVSAVEKRTGRPIIFASFHGDTDGLATLPALTAVHAIVQKHAPAPLVFGLDANTYLKGKPGKQLGVDEFVKFYKELGYYSNFGDMPMSACLTTSIARTFLQPQLQKACKAADTKSLGDFNPKDHILFTASAFELVDAGKDNMGTKSYVEDMVVPTPSWPSDHGLVYADLKLK